MFLSKFNFFRFYVYPFLPPSKPSSFDLGVTPSFSQSWRFCTFFSSRRPLLPRRRLCRPKSLNQNSWIYPRKTTFSNPLTPNAYPYPLTPTFSPYLQTLSPNPNLFTLPPNPKRFLWFFSQTFPRLLSRKIKKISK